MTRRWQEPGGENRARTTVPRSPKPLVAKISESLRVCCGVIILLYAVNDLAELWAWICVPVAIVAVLGTHSSRTKPAAIDFAVLGLLTFEVLSIPLSSFPSNSWNYVEQLTVGIAVYFCIRALRSKMALSVVALLVCGLTAAMVAPDARYFFDRYSEWVQLNFGTVSDVRQSLTVVDASPAGAHYTIYLILAAWGIAACLAQPRGQRWIRWAGVFALSGDLFGILISLSRGIYLGMAAGVCCLYVLTRMRLRLVFRKNRTLIAAALVLLSVLLLMPFASRSSVAAPENMSSESADRSIKGRFFLWRNTLKRAAAKPLLGFGARTFVLYGTEGLTQDSGEPVDRAFSFPIQLFFERGLIGVVVYAVFFAVVMLTAVRSGRRSLPRRLGCTLSVAATAGLVAVLVRDLTYTTLFDNKTVTIAVFSLIGLISFEESRMQPEEPKYWWPGLFWKKIALLGVGLSLTIVVCGHRLRQAAADWYAMEAVHADLLQDNTSAIQYTLRALSTLPSGYLEAQAGLFSGRAAGLALGDRGGPVLAHVSDAFVQRNLREAESFYRRSTNEFPDEADWQHNLAWLLWLRGDRPLALQKFRQAVRLEPGTSVYRQSLILLLMEMADLNSARDELATLLTLSPEVVDSPWWASLESEQPEIAQSALKLAISDLGAIPHPGPIQMAREARLCLEAGNIDSSEKLLVESLRKLPSMSGAWRNYGLILLGRGDWQNASQALERAVFLDPWDSTSYYALSQVALHLPAGRSEPDPSLKRLSSMFRNKAARTQASRLWSPGSLRASRRLQIQSPVHDDLVVSGLLVFCMPEMTRAYDRLVSPTSFGSGNQR